jgi:hypothetical protein
MVDRVWLSLCHVMCTDAEIEEFYRARGEEPPPRRAPQPSSNTPPRPAQQSQQPSTSKRRKRHAPARLLWHPIRPALAQTLTDLPSTAAAHPFKTCGTVMVLLPFSGLVIFLPGMLVTDHFLQKLYSAYGGSVEVVVDDGLQMARLGYVMAKLGVRQTYRVVRRQVGPIAPTTGTWLARLRSGLPPYPPSRPSEQESQGMDG